MIFGNEKEKERKKHYVYDVAANKSMNTNINIDQAVQFSRRGRKGGKGKSKCSRQGAKTSSE